MDRGRPAHRAVSPGDRRRARRGREHGHEEVTDAVPLRRALRAAYALAAGAATTLSRIGRWGAPRATDPKWLRALRARSGLLDRYAEWSRADRDTTQPLLWVHAPSVGEGLQARPVLELLDRARLQVVYTYFSPSAETFAATLRRSALVDFADYLPFDTRAAAESILDALTPTALVFSKLDVWPVLVERAAARGVRLGLISATLSADSSRGTGVGRLMLHDAYARFDAVGAIDPADADRLIALGVRPEVITVTGDTRYDQVWARAHPIDARAIDAPTSTRWRDARHTIVAGSTWPADERVLLPAWRQGWSTARLVIAPHEPTPSHVAALEHWARTAGVRAARLDHAEAATADLVIVDRLGILGDLYGIADAAFVGGAFHAAGLHSTLEPAAFGVPVLVGPRYARSRDAVRLIAAGGAYALTSAADLTPRLRAWAESDADRREAGARAREVVRQGLGAAQRSAAIVERLLTG